MRKGDIIWGLVFALFIGFVVLKQELFITLTKSYPFIAGFIKFSILASMGEMLTIRIVTGEYKKLSGFFARVVIWGFIGIAIVLMFNIFALGIKEILEKGLIAGAGNKYAFAIYTSLVMNLIFAPTFMAFHRYTDTFIDLYYGGQKNIKVTDVTKAIDWNGFVSFVIVKTIPFFWIPAHFITFLLPSEYRVLFAALLSIALGAILAFGKRKK